MRIPSAFTPLKIATFRRLWMSTTAYNTGLLIQSVAAAWSMAAISSADDVALIQTALFLPVALLALPAGAAADSYDRRKIQIVGFLISMASAAFLAAFSHFNTSSPLVLIAFCCLAGCGSALAAPARGASIPEQVPREQVPAAVGLYTIGYNVARSIGPALGGFIVALSGTTSAFVVSILAHIPVLASLKRWNRPPEVKPIPPEGLLRSVSTGVRYVALVPAVRRTILRAFVICVLGSVLVSLVPLIARDILGGDARTFGILLASFGLGAVSGAFVLQPLREQLNNENITRLCSMVQAASLAILSLSNSLYIDILFLAAAGMGWMMIVTTLNVSAQTSVPLWISGRAIAACSASISLGVAVGAWIWGMVAKEFGIATVLQLAAVGFVLSVALGRVLRIADIAGTADLDASPLTDPEVKLAINGNSGPIGVELRYRISDSRAEEFYQLMRVIQLTRTRSGAYGWTLSRGIGDPELWSEHFRLPTWNDYLRQRNRRSLRDAELQRQAKNMHIGPEPLQIFRWLDRPSSTVQLREDGPGNCEALRQPV